MAKGNGQQTGEVSSISDKGFGFIETDDGGRLFFHATNVPDCQFDSLYETQRVEFAIEDHVKGLRAVGVKSEATTSPTRDVRQATR